MSEIKLFVTHTPNRNTVRIEHPLMYNVIAGSAFLTQSVPEGMLLDNEGDNISFKNKSYCELTTQYWAWKNQTADYYGFCHYRRYFSFSKVNLQEADCGCLIYPVLSENVKQELCMDEASMRQTIEQYDFLIAKGIPVNALQAKSVYQHYKSAETDEYVSLRVGAAEIWDDVVAYAVSKGWGGIENLSLIPGEAGAAAIQNIGAYGMEIKDVIESVEAYNQLTFEKRTFTNSDCEYGYRNSYFKNEHHDPHIITYITLRLSKNPGFSVNYGNLKEELTKYPEVTLETIREAVITIRRQKLPDPEVLGNAGSFFMNPIITAEHFEKLKKQFPEIPSYPASEGKIKVPAGWLIEQCGFKGKNHGSVGVYEKQALVLVNLGDARGDEIALVAESIRTAVKDRFGIELMPEVKYVG